MLKILFDLMAKSEAYDCAIERVHIQSVEEGGTLRFWAEKYSKLRGFDSWASFVRACK